MPTWALVVIPLFVAIVGPVLTYKATTRVASGKVSTSAADTLWQELNGMKDEYREQARTAGIDNTRLREELAEVRSVAVTSQALASEAKRATADCERREAVLMARLTEIEGS